MMSDRKLRAVMAFAFLAGTFITLVTLGLYLTDLPPWLMVTIFALYSVAQVSLAPLLYKRIYQSKWIDIPEKLREKYPPLGYEFLKKEGVQTQIYDVILLRPPSAILSGPDSGEALGLGYLAGVLRKAGKKVLFIDARLMGLDTMQTVELITMFRAPILGINLNFQYLAESTRDLLISLEERGFESHITLGGLYASVAYTHLMKTMPQVDTIVRFEGEKTFQEFLEKIGDPASWSGIESLVYRDLNGGITANPLRSLIHDLNTIAHPQRDFLPIVSKIGGYAYVLSSRGCHGTCAYCVQQRSVSDPKGRRWRGRDPEDVVDEMQELIRVEKIESFSFVDDDFFGDKVDGKTHARRVADAIIRRGVKASILLSIQPRDVTLDEFRVLKRAGVDSVILAVDNFSQAVLDRYAKFTKVEQNLESIHILDSLDIDAYLGIIMFDPWTTLEELDENMAVLVDLPFIRPWQVLSKLEIYQGSSLTGQLEEQGLLKWDTYTAAYDYLDDRIQNVYRAIENIMKILHPSMMELDKFRWGNLQYSDADEAVLKNSKAELKDLNVKYNNQAIDFCKRIIAMQQKNDEPLGVHDLADPQMEREAEVMNEMTLREVTTLRKNAMEKQYDLEMVPS